LAQWVITTEPLGGVPPGGGAEIPTPSLTGWGREDGSGFTVFPWHVSVSVWGPRENTVFAAPATIDVTIGAGSDPGYEATDLSLYLGSTLLATKPPSTTLPFRQVFQTPPLSAGTYSLSGEANGAFSGDPRFNSTGPIRSLPITITVVDPILVTLTPPTITNNQLTFQYTVNPGLTYTIQTSTDLTTWQTIETNKPASSPATFTQPFTSAPATYYQIQRAPNP
jgi:hypothetical protein